MKREIKFKAKSQSDRRWLIGDLAHTDGRVYIIPFDPNELDSMDRYEVDHDTICQFTGLYDRDGNEVWEGDVLGASNKTIGKVIFEDGCFKVSMNSFGKTELYCWRRAKKLGDCCELPN